MHYHTQLRNLFFKMFLFRSMLFNLHLLLSFLSCFSVIDF
jgi:hypothetical protein